MVDLMGGSKSMWAVDGVTLHERMGRRETDLFGFAVPLFMFLFEKLFMIGPIVCLSFLEIIILNDKIIVK
jgi:hypothetical protein